MVALLVISVAAGCGAAAPSPAQLVERAAEKTAALKSVAFDLVRVGDPVLLEPRSALRFSAATGEYQAPDRVHAKVKVIAAGAVLTIDVLWLSTGTYASNPFTGAYDKLPGELGFDPAALVRREVPAILRGELRDLALVKEKEKVGAAEAYHLRGTVDGARLRAVTGGIIVQGAHTIDFWIDAATFQLLRLVDAEPAGATSGWRLELSRFDEPVEIKGP